MSVYLVEAYLSTRERRHCRSIVEAAIASARIWIGTLVDTLLPVLWDSLVLNSEARIASVQFCSRCLFLGCVAWRDGRMARGTLARCWQLPSGQVRATKESDNGCRCLCVVVACTV